MNGGATLRARLKRAVESLLGSEWLGVVHRRRLRGSRLVLAYHNILPQGAPPASDRSLHCSFDQFCRHLDVLEERAAIASLDDLLQGSAASPAVAITFDDAYAGALRYGLPELARRGLPATVFVAPGLLGAGAPWWDAIADSSGMDDRVREHCLQELGGESARVRAWSEREGRPYRMASDGLRVASEDELVQAAGNKGMTFGAHSWSHPNLTRCESLGAELERPLPWLRQRVGERARNWLAYPYGLNNEAVRIAARAGGYEAAFLVQGGWHRGDVNPFAIPRINVPAGLSAGGMAARLNGWLG